MLEIALNIDVAPFKSNPPFLKPRLGDLKISQHFTTKPYALKLH
jgi:hypothetical protein